MDVDEQFALAGTGADEQQGFSTVGWALVILGGSIMIFSPKIVFPGLEWLLGIETIVGRDNVSYQHDGRYVFTNPGAMSRWILSVAGVGLLIGMIGLAMLWSACRKSRIGMKASN